MRFRIQGVRQRNQGFLGASAEQVAAAEQDGAGAGGHGRRYAKGGADSADAAGKYAGHAGNIHAGCVGIFRGMSGMIPSHDASRPDPHARLRALGLALPPPPAPKGWYVPVAVTGTLAFVSGQLPLRDGTVAVTGTVGAGVAVEAAREAARLCLLNVLAALEGAGIALGDVRRVVKLTGFVQSAPDFHEQPLVLNAASELLTEIFGDAGRHARAAVGAAALPLDAAVEIEAVFEVAGAA